ncbi:MAG: cell division protein SepF [Clostridia bacterium]|nr:cell division protein SepF [Clostridia bacterium]MBR2413697.1 cell division protein SepF [Clostridia bacterium]MBR3955124.1 cell division protein SepF [Clostridia bacterium]
MAFGDKVRKILNIDESEFFDDVDTEDVDVAEPEAEPEPRITRVTPPRRTERRASSAVSSGFSSGGRVVDIHTTAKLQVVLKKPERFDDATAIADELLDKRTVLINMEDTAKEEINKILWFLSGVAYANGGNLKKVAKRTYMITPYNVDVLGDLLDELENNGMFFV